MVQFGDILWRSKSRVACCALALSLGLTGCTDFKMDSVRPEVNNENAMVVFPNSLTGKDALESDDGTEDSTGPDSGIGSDGEGNVGGESGSGGVVGGNAYAALPYNVVSARDYSTYLDTQVFRPVAEAVGALENGNSSHLYFRVFHSGYDPITENATQISRGSIYDNKAIGNLRSIAGTALPMFTYRWLNAIPLNAGVVTGRRAGWLEVLNKASIAVGTTWMQAAATPGVNEWLLSLWGNERLEADTFSEYLQQARSSVIGTLPNVSFRVALNGSSKTTITINDVSNLNGARYVDSMSKVDVDRLFGYYNQYPNRQATALSLREVNEYNMLFTYVDGYSKTIVVLGCAPGYTLKELLGDKFSTVTKKIESVLDYTKWTEIAAYVEDVVVLQSGVRGID